MHGLYFSIAIQLISFSLFTSFPPTYNIPYPASSLILPPNAKGHLWDDEWVNMSDGYWLRPTCWVWDSWGSLGKYTQTFCSSNQLSALTRMQQDSILNILTKIVPVILGSWHSLQATQKHSKQLLRTLAWANVKVMIII